MTDSIARRLLPERLYYWQWRLRKPDRRYMESAILPALANTRPTRVLSVGTRRYCAHYGNFFVRSGGQYWTMDIDPDAAKFGAKHRHLTGNVINIDQYFEPASFDVVLLNGILGWGVDSGEDQISVLSSLRKIMRRGGVLLIGWNDHLLINDIVLMAADHGFRHGSKIGLPERIRFANSTHVYDLFTATEWPYIAHSIDGSTT